MQLEMATKTLTVLGASAAGKKTLAGRLIYTVPDRPSFLQRICSDCY